MEPISKQKNVGILNKDRWYLTGFVIYSLSFWLIIRLTVSMEMKRKITSVSNKYAKKITILLFWIISTDVALLVNLVWSILPREKQNRVSRVQKV